MPRFYENKYPEVSSLVPYLQDTADIQVDSLVMVQVVAIEEMGAYVKLVRPPSRSGGRH